MFIVVMLVIAFLIPYPTPFQYTIFRVFLALAAAGFTAILPNFIRFEASSSIHKVRTSTTTIIFIVVFIITLIFNPAKLAIGTPTISLNQVNYYLDDYASDNTWIVYKPQPNNIKRFWIGVKAKAQGGNFMIDKVKVSLISRDRFAVGYENQTFQDSYFLEQDKEDWISIAIEIGDWEAVVQMLSRPAKIELIDSNNKVIASKELPLMNLNTLINGQNTQ